MHDQVMPWVIVLAAGSGTRLSELTCDSEGQIVPKQFCSLRGGRTLLLDTLDRALRLTVREKVVVVVAAQHEKWWAPQLRCLDRRNIVVQPENRGTTAGILLPLAHVLEADPDAVVAVLPSDHFVAEPEVLNDSMRQALRQVATSPDRVMLLGITPESADGEYGWIVPAPGAGGAIRPVAAFVEKPPVARAEALMEARGVWNSFLFAANAATLWGLCEAFAPQTAAAIFGATASASRRRDEALAEAYRELPNIDFSHTVLGGSAARLGVITVPACGWTDLGTPSRVRECLDTIERGHPHLPARAPWFATVDLWRRVGTMIATSRSA